MKKFLFSAVVVLFACISVYAQNMTVTGIVSSNEDSMAIPGAIVMVKGTNNGTSTDMDGRYSISVAKGDVLVYTVLGYETREVTVGEAAVIDVILNTEDSLLDEVVVTAMGMKREKKALTYSVQDLKGESLLENRTANIASSLSGKIAGMQVTATGVPGGSNRIVIRGESSLNNNQPLVVIDGVPYDNTQGTGDTDSEAWGGYDYGDGLGLVNQDDIESISVLKGPSAAALYGSRGGAGVILITTKTGKKGKPVVSFSNNTTFERAFLEPDFQNEYGQGDDLGVWSSSSRVSWGPRMGTMITDWKTGKQVAMSPTGSNFSAFMQTGYSTTNSVDVSGGTDKVNYRFGVSSLIQEGVIPNNGINKTNFTTRVSAELLPRLTGEVKISYANLKGKNRPATSVSGRNPIFALIYTPRSINLRDMEELFDESGNYLDWYTMATGKTLSTIQNPYAICNLLGNEDITNRITAHANLKWEPAGWFNIKGQYGIDTYSLFKESWRRHGLFGADEGMYSVDTKLFSEMNADILATMHMEDIAGSKVSLSGSVGANLMRRFSRSTSETATGLNVPELYTISNGITISAGNSRSKKEIQSVYGMFHAEYDDYLFLDVTGRNDWSSTLPKGNWSYFYPSVSLGWIITEMLGKTGADVPDWWTYSKVRAAYAEVGKDTDPYQLYPTMVTAANQTNGQLIACLPGARPNSELKPERQTGYELGLESRFFGGRLSFDFTWYDQTTKDQIISLPTSITTGYNSKMINAGAINNKGIELIVDAIPVETKDWNWKLSFGYSKNWSKVLELAPGIDSYTLANPMGQNIYVVAQVGKPYGEILTNDIAVNDRGEKLVGDNGKYVVDGTLRSKGNMNPEWTGSLTSTLRWKNLDFSFAIDARIGGKMYLQSMMRLESNGQVKSTLPGREEWLTSGKGMVCEGVNVNTGMPNTVEIDPKTYYSQFYGTIGHYVYSTTNVRMREMSLGYSFPKTWFSDSIVSGIRFSLVANNMFFFYNALPGYDPECTYSTGNAQGVETCALPSTRRFGFNFNITF